MPTLPLDALWARWRSGNNPDLEVQPATLQVLLQQAVGWRSIRSGCGGIGRRAGFRSQWGQPRGGSSPLIRNFLYDGHLASIPAAVSAVQIASLRLLGHTLASKVASRSGRLIVLGHTFFAGYWHSAQVGRLRNGNRDEDPHSKENRRPTCIDHLEERPMVSAIPLG